MAMSDKMPSMEEMTKSLMADRKMSKPKTEEGSLVAREVEVAGDFENQLMKMYKMHLSKVTKDLLKNT